MNARYVRCVAIDAPGERVEAFGSCVPAVLGGKPLMLTAKHVLDRIGGRRPLLEVDGRFQPLSGSLRSADSEEVDVSVLELPDESVDWGLDFVDLNLEREPTLGPDEVEILVSMGFPIADSQSLTETEQLALKRITYWSFEAEAAYEPLSLDRRRSIAAKYDRKRSFEEGEQKMPKQPYGMSGGAMWRFWGPHTEFPTLDRCGLAGVLVSYHEGTAKCMVAGRLCVLQDLATRLLANSAG